mmetsp:Transcript_129577/g.415441  ORF Transcript_129577/g.415441 Transcript_129577/m.415441 type:complete len:243 (-) Transcript_129577:476-1204(-)
MTTRSGVFFARAWRFQQAREPPVKASDTNGRPLLLDTTSATFWICCARSVVGAMTMIFGAGCASAASPRSAGSQMCRLISGNRYANVFPEPACSAMTTSLPVSRSLYDRFWIREGRGSSSLRTSSCMSSDMPGTSCHSFFEKKKCGAARFSASFAFRLASCHSVAVRKCVHNCGRSSIDRIFIASLWTFLYSLLSLILCLFFNDNIADSLNTSCTSSSLLASLICAVTSEYSLCPCTVLFVE